jgi:hypothetical protein
MAVHNLEDEGLLEPPLLERMVSFAYRVAGGEYLWVPRLFSITFWLIGGAFLYLLSRRIASDDAALCSCAFYLLLPYATAASRSFQPDPMMVMALLASLLFIDRYYEEQVARRLLVAAIASSLAVFIKPMCLFVIMGAWFFKGIHDRRLYRALFRPASAVFVALALLPSFIYYFLGIFKGGFLESQAGASFIPGLFLTGYYYQGWLMMIHRVVPAPIVVAALLGVWLSGPGKTRALLAGLWVGYLAFGLVFNYHIHTHDYYQLQLVPIAALSLAPALDFVFERLWRLMARRELRAAVFLFVIAFAAFYNVALVRLDREERTPLVDVYVRISREIGDAVGHSPKTIMLDYAWGKPLQYYGEISGRLWPASIEIKRGMKRGEPPMAAPQRFIGIDPDRSYEYFIVVALEDFARQPDLQAYLFRNYSLLKKSDRYLVFDLQSDKVGGTAIK